MDPIPALRIRTFAADAASKPDVDNAEQNEMLEPRADGCGNDVGVKQKLTVAVLSDRENLLWLTAPEMTERVLSRLVRSSSANTPCVGIERLACCERGTMIASTSAEEATMQPLSMAELMTEPLAASSNSTMMIVLFNHRFEVPSLIRGEQAVSALLRAFELLTHRGNGSAAWASPFRDNALAFLLDSMSDATNLWGAEGELLYRNRAAEQLDIGRCDDTAVEELTIYGRPFERRTARYRCGDKEYLFEILRDLELARPPTERALIGPREPVRSESHTENFRAW